MLTCFGNFGAPAVWQSCVEQGEHTHWVSKHTNFASAATDERAIRRPNADSSSDSGSDSVWQMIDKEAKHCSCFYWRKGFHRFSLYSRKAEVLCHATSQSWLAMHTSDINVN